MKTTLFRWSQSEDIIAIKTHRLLPLNNLENQYICMTIRDPRDIAVSIKRFFLNETRKSLTHYLDVAVNSYYEARKYDHVLWQRYEDLVAAPELCVRELSQYLGADLAENEIKTIVDEVSLDKTEEKIACIESDPRFRVRRNYKLLLAKLGFKSSTIRKITFFAKNKLPEFLWRSDLEKQTVLRYAHISQNPEKSGKWQNNLTQEEMDLITRYYKKWLTDMGYI